MALNFASYFEKLSERFAQLSDYCPRLSAYTELFKESIRLQTSLSDFYVVVVKFCTKALEVIQEKGVKNITEQIQGQRLSILTVGMKRFVKSLWKDFNSDFGQLEENISAAKEEVDEMKFASGQRCNKFMSSYRLNPGRLKSNARSN